MDCILLLRGENGSNSETAVTTDDDRAEGGRRTRVILEGCRGMRIRELDEGVRGVLLGGGGDGGGSISSSTKDEGNGEVEMRRREIFKETGKEVTVDDFDFPAASNTTTTTGSGRSAGTGSGGDSSTGSPNWKYVNERDEPRIMAWVRLDHAKRLESKEEGEKDKEDGIKVNENDVGKGKGKVLTEAELSEVRKAWEA